MDLLHYGQQAAANGLLNRYLGMTSVDHLDALALLPLFLSMRSAIRAHVLLMRQTVGNTAAGKAAIGKAAVDNAANIDDARAYFGLARALLHPPAPVLVAVGGLSGTGKSVVARALAPFVAPQPGAVVLRSDVLRKQLFGVGETERLQADGYRPEVTERVYDELRRRTETVLSQGHSVVVDAVSARETERAVIRDAARRAKVAFAGIFLAADLATRQRRVGRRRADASDATPEVAALQETYNIGPIDWAIVDASGTSAATLKHCQTHLIQMQAAAAV